MANHRFTAEAGRTIYRDGKPYISIQAHGRVAGEHEPHEPGDHWYDPTTIDEVFREIANKVFNCDYNIPSDDRSKPGFVGVHRDKTGRRA